MARYIKANPKVAAYLHLENDRLKLKDGNYILWQGDMTAFAPLPMLNDTLTKIGAIALMPHEAKQEQDGTVVRPLPIATGERFVMETEKEQTKADTETATNDEQKDDESNSPASVKSETAVDGESDEQPTDEVDSTASMERKEQLTDDDNAPASTESKDQPTDDEKANSESEQITDGTIKEE